MTSKLGFYLHSSQDNHGLWGLFERIKPPVILIHLEAKNDDLLRQMREWRSPDTFVVGRLGMDRDEQRRYLDDPDPVAAGQRLADKIFNQDRSFLLKRYPDQPGGRLLVDAWMSLNEPIEGPSWEGAAQQDDAWHRTNREQHRRYDRLQVAFRRRLREYIHDVEAVAFNFGAGNFKQAQQYIQLYPETLGEYTYLGFHEYGWPAMAKHLTQRPVKTDAGLFPAIMQGIRADPKYGARHRAIITEAGLARAHLHAGSAAGDVGWLNTVETVSQEEYWKSLRWYNDLLRQHEAYVLGACLYQVGWMDDWKSFRLTGDDNQGRPIEIMNWIADPSQAPK
ncbi:MAG: hypothetical protein WAV60_11365 [Anaerolineae bacterium]